MIASSSNNWHLKVSDRFFGCELKSTIWVKSGNIGSTECDLGYISENIRKRQDIVTKIYVQMKTAMKGLFTSWYWRVFMICFSLLVIYSKSTQLLHIKSFVSCYECKIKLNNCPCRWSVFIMVLENSMFESWSRELGCLN